MSAKQRFVVRINVTKCLKSLNASISECRTRRDELLAKRHADTCLWVFTDSRYHQWLDSSEVLLWIPGGPGSGKSVLSAVLAEEMASTDEFITAYFFCKDTDERLRSETAILKHLLAQILEQNPFLLQYFEQESDYRRDEDRTSWSSGMLWRVFEVICMSKVRPICLIVDAIGMCSIVLNQGSSTWICARTDLELPRPAEMFGDERLSVLQCRC
jgi:hypothetical protein